MNRLIVITALSLCFLSCFLNLVFADKPEIRWNDIRLTSKEGILTLENRGNFDIKNFSVSIKIYDGEKLVSSSSISKNRCLQEKGMAKIRLALNKELSQDKTYRVVAYFQSGKSSVVFHQWDDRMLSLVLRTPQLDKSYGVIPEPYRLKKSIHPIDIQKELSFD